MSDKLEVCFYEEASGKEPVRKWLQGLAKEDKRIIGEDLKKVQYRWPLGLPLIKTLGDGLWEVRSTLPNRIARIIFMMKDSQIVLLHGFIKKTNQTPKQDLELARERSRRVKERRI